MLPLGQSLDNPGCVILDFYNMEAEHQPLWSWGD